MKIRLERAVMGFVAVAVVVGMVLWVSGVVESLRTTFRGTELSRTSGIITTVHDDGKDARITVAIEASREEQEVTVPSEEWRSLGLVRGDRIDIVVKRVTTLAKPK